MVFSDHYKGLVAFTSSNEFDLQYAMLRCMQTISDQEYFVPSYSVLTKTPRHDVHSYIETHPNTPPLTMDIKLLSTISQCPKEMAEANSYRARTDTGETLTTYLSPSHAILRQSEEIHDL
jgi:hypothetical protein